MQSEEQGDKKESYTVKGDQNRNGTDTNRNQRALPSPILQHRLCDCHKPMG